MENEKQIKNLFERLRQNKNSVLYGNDNVTNTLIKKQRADEKHRIYFTLYFKPAKESLNENYSERREKLNFTFYTSFMDEKKYC